MEDLCSVDGDDQPLLVVNSIGTPFPEPVEVEVEAEPLISPTPTAPQKLRPVRNLSRLQPPRRQVEVKVEADNDTPPGELELGFEFGFGFEQQILKLKSDMDANFVSSINSHFCQLVLPFSAICSSSESDATATGSSHSAADKPGPKTKTKKRKKLESFLQDLLAQVIDKQERMHQQLMVLIENKERDRIRREQAWRRHQLELAHNQQHLRSQQAARNLALLSFVRNALAHQGTQLLHLPPIFGNDQTQTPTETDPNDNRWLTSEVQALIALSTALDRTMAPNASTSLSDQVSAGMADMGSHRNAKKCNKPTVPVPVNAQSRPYFHELQTNSYRNQLVTTGKADCPSPSEDIILNSKENSESGNDY